MTGLLFGEGGWMNISRADAVRSISISLWSSGWWRAAGSGRRVARRGRGARCRAGPHAGRAERDPAGDDVRAAGAGRLRRAPPLVRRTAVPASRPGTRVTEPPPTPAAGVAQTPRAGSVALAGLLAVVCWWLPPVMAADGRERR